MPEILLVLTVPEGRSEMDISAAIYVLSTRYDWATLRRLPDGERFTEGEKATFKRASLRMSFHEKRVRGDIADTMSPAAKRARRLVADEAKADAAALRRMAGLEETDA